MSREILDELIGKELEGGRNPTQPFRTGMLAERCQARRDIEVECPRIVSTDVDAACGKIERVVYIRTTLANTAGLLVRCGEPGWDRPPCAPQAYTAMMPGAAKPARPPGRAADDPDVPDAQAGHCAGAVPRGFLKPLGRWSPSPTGRDAGENGGASAGAH